MKTAAPRGPGDIRVEKVPDPGIQALTGTIVHVAHTAIRGSGP